MYYSIDKLEFIIKKMNNIACDETPLELIIFEIPWYTTENIWDIIKDFQKNIIYKNGPFDWYNFIEKTSIYEQWASGMAQEIIFAVSMWVMGNLATDVVKIMYARLKKKFAKKENNWLENLEDYFWKVIEIFSKYYNKKVIISGHKKYKNYFIVHAKSWKNNYEIKFNLNYDITEIKKI